MGFFSFLNALVEEEVRSRSQLRVTILLSFDS